MRSRCLLQLSLIFAAAVLRTQSHSVFHPAMFRSIHPSRSVRSHTPEVQDQEMVEALRSSNPNVLEVALHALSLPNYVILRIVRTFPAYWAKLSSRAKVTKEQVIFWVQRSKSNKGDENSKFHKWQNIKFNKPRGYFKLFTTLSKRRIQFQACAKK